MTPDEIAKQRELLLSKQRELELELAKLAEQEKIAAEQEPLKVIITSCDDDRIQFKMSRFDESLVEVFRHIPTRYYHGSGINSIEPTKLPELESALSNASVVLEYASPEVQANVSALLDRPNFVITLDGRGNRLVIKPRPGISSNMFLHVPGHKWDYDNRVWTIPVWEGWRVHQALNGQEKVEWSEEAIGVVKADLEKRAKLEQLATEKDATLDLALNGHTLYPFQRVGVNFVAATGYRAMVTDQPGLGKSPQFIASVKLLERELGRPVRAAIICPANLKRNWLVQIHKFTGESGAIFKGLEPKPLDYITLMDHEQTPKWCIFNYDILGRRVTEKVDQVDEAGRHIVGEVTKYLWVNVINAAQFDIICVDEAHYIKNVDSHRSKAVRGLSCPRVVFLTATPVTNRPRELWPMLTMINRELFPSHEVFLNTYEGYNGRARNTQELIELLKPLMIRRLKKDVVSDLPPINRIYEFYELSDKAQKIYNRVLEGIYEDWIKGEGREQTVTHILAKITRLKQVCAIDKMDSVAELATDLYDAADNGEAIKVLVFSQFVPVATGIARRLGSECLLVTGQTPDSERDGIVSKFQTDDKVHFLVATKGVLSEGRDLTKAGYVIFADLFWTPAAHEQAEGRAYGRLSDLHSITSYYCIAKCEGGEESIEDWIQQILAKKLAVIETVVEGVEANRSASIANELLEKMRQELFSKRAR